MADEFLTVTDRDRETVVAYAIKRKMPKNMIAHYQSKEADNEPLVQMVAGYRQTIENDLKAQLQDSYNKIDAMSHTVGGFSTQLGGLKKILKDVRRRAEGTIFSKGADIIRIIDQGLAKL